LTLFLFCSSEITNYRRFGGTLDTERERGRRRRVAARRELEIEISTESASLRPGRIFVALTPAAIVCIGFADTERAMRLAFEDEGPTNPFRDACRRIEDAVARGGHLAARQLGLEVPFDAIDEPSLLRLSAAVRLLKAGFDPDQPRDADGRWTDEDGDPGQDGGSTDPTISDSARPAAAAILGTAAEAAAPWSVWTENALALLSDVAATAAGPLALAGGLALIPLNRSGVAEGTVENRPDLAYRYDEGILTILQTNAQGERAVLFHGLPGEDHFYRDKDGNVLGRNLEGSGIVLDPALVLVAIAGPLPGGVQESARPTGEELARNVEKARAIIAEQSNPTLCPRPEADFPGGTSEEAMAYQEYVTRMPRGVAFYIGKVSFDGCEFWKAGDMAEAKGDGYDWPLSEDGLLLYEPDWEADMEEQMKKQSAAAATVGKRVNWYVSEERLAKYLTRFVEEKKLFNITVIHLPAPPLQKLGCVQ